MHSINISESNILCPYSPLNHTYNNSSLSLQSANIKTGITQSTYQFLIINGLSLRTQLGILEGEIRGINGYSTSQVKIFSLSYSYKVTLVHTLSLPIKIRFTRNLSYPLK
jgi:hypothetical protein